LSFSLHVVVLEMMSLSLPCHHDAQQYDDLTSRHAIEHSASDANSEAEGHAEQPQQHNLQPLSAAAQQSATTTAAAHSLQSRQFTCLYSKHKTQKRKTWLDGRLVVFGSGKVALHAACPPVGSGDPVLDQTELTRSQARAILDNHLQNMELEKYLITVDGPWMPPPTSMTSTSNAIANIPVSNGMHKVLSTKFQKPAAIAPPPPPPHWNTTTTTTASTTTSTMEHWAKRRKQPLQPGELVRRYYYPSASPFPTATIATTATTEPHHFVPPPRHTIAPSSSSSSYVPTPQHCHSQWPQRRHESAANHYTRNNVATPIEAPPPPPPLHSYRGAPSSSTRDLESSSSHEYATTAPTFVERISPPAHSLPSPDDLPAREQSSWTGMAAVQQPRRDANSFVTNGFNTNSYYGEDFDDEDETDDQQPAPFHLQPTKVAQTTSHVLTVPESVPPTGHHRGTTNATTTVEARSAADLLALFDVTSSSSSTQIDESEHNEMMGGADEYILPSQESSDASTS
jgi:Protein of unknown function (DUF2439)